MLLGLISQQHTSIHQRHIRLDSCTCCHTEIETANQTCYLSQSQDTDTPSTSPRANSVTSVPGRVTHYSTDFLNTGITLPGKEQEKLGSIPSLPLLRQMPTAGPLNGQHTPTFKTLLFLGERLQNTNLPNANSQNTTNLPNTNSQNTTNLLHTTSQNTTNLPNTTSQNTTNLPNTTSQNTPNLPIPPNLPNTNSRNTTNIPNTNSQITMNLPYTNSQNTTNVPNTNSQNTTNLPYTSSLSEYHQFT